jgi:hypothetical protein
MLDRIEPSVVKLVEHLEDHSTYREPDVARSGRSGGADHDADAGHGAAESEDEEAHG